MITVGTVSSNLILSTSDIFFNDVKVNTSNEVKIDQNDIEKQGTKKWNNIGNIAKPKVYLQLMRNVTCEVAKLVPMVDTKLVGETDTVSWSNLQKKLIVNVSLGFIQ